MKRLIVNSILCSGCRLCELICSFIHENEFLPSKARLHVVINRGIRMDTPAELIDIPHVCNQCDPAPCAEVCPTDAICIDQNTKIPWVDEQACSGCGICVEECPEGMILLDEDRQVAFKCDLCGGDPKCVRYCPRGALEYVSQD